MTSSCPSTAPLAICQHDICKSSLGHSLTFEKQSEPVARTLEQVVRACAQPGLSLVPSSSESHLCPHSRISSGLSSVLCWLGRGGLSLATHTSTCPAVSCPTHIDRTPLASHSRHLRSPLDTLARRFLADLSPPIYTGFAPKLLRDDTANLPQNRQTASDHH